MKSLIKDRIYRFIDAFVAVLCVVLLIESIIRMAMQWDSFTTRMIVGTAFKQLFWIVMAWICINKFRHRLGTDAK